MRSKINRRTGNSEAEAVAVQKGRGINGTRSTDDVLQKGVQHTCTTKRSCPDGEDQPGTTGRKG